MSFERLRRTIPPLTPVEDGAHRDRRTMQTSDFYLAPIDERLNPSPASARLPLALHCCIGAGRGVSVRQSERGSGGGEIYFCLTAMQQQLNAKNNINQRVLNSESNDTIAVYG